jgi:L-lactate dehydrogenase complex protein LldF
VRIDIPRMLIELRQGGVEHGTAPRAERLVFRAFAWLLRHPALFRRAAALGRLLQRPFVRQGRIRRLPGGLGAWTRRRDLAPVAGRTFSERWAELERER